MNRCPDIVASSDLHGANERLRSWAGAHALVLGSGITHRHFRIDLWKEGVDTQLAVLCAIPEYIAARSAGVARWFAWCARPKRTSRGTEGHSRCATTVQA